MEASNSICLDGTLTLRKAQVKAEEKLHLQYRDSIGKLNREQCLSFLANLLRKEMTKSNLREVWRNNQNSSNIDLRPEQEFELIKISVSLKTKDITEVRTYLTDALRNSLVQDELVRVWITGGCELQC